MTSPTTPRDAIGLSERLRERAALIGPPFMTGIRPLLDEAATQLDALQERLKELGAERMKQIDYYVDLQRIIEGLCHERAIREPKTGARYHYDMAVKYQSEAESRATRAEQERDEAKAEERESFQKYVDANEARIEAVQERDEAVASTRYKIFDNLLGAYIGADEEQIRVAIGNLAYMIFPEYRDELRNVARGLAAGPDKEKK